MNSNEVNRNLANHNEEMGSDDIDHGFTPMAICGMACRLSGGIQSPQQLWESFLPGGDARSRVPEFRYNVDAYYSPTRQPGIIKTPYEYFLAEDHPLHTGSTTPLNSPNNHSIWRKDPRIAAYRNIATGAANDGG